MTAAFQATFSDVRTVSRRERFERKIIPEPNSGCWLWIGAAHRHGYGSVKSGGKGWKAHRLSWEMHRGPIPAGLSVLHKCDNPTCVNPDHLWLGTALDNALDREAKGRGNQPSGDRNGARTKPESRARGDKHYARLNPGVKAGDRNGRAKLTPEQVIAIRKDARPSRFLAAQYGVSRKQIKAIRARRAWTHL